MMKNNHVLQAEHVLLYHFLNDENHTQMRLLRRKNLFDRMC